MRVLGIAASAAGLIAATVIVGLSEVAAGRSPDFAIQLNSWQSEGLANAALMRLKDGNSRGAAEAQRLSERAIRLNPASAAGVRNLGYIADMRGDNRRAGLLFEHAERLSRRDVMAQMWLIERQVAAGDVAGALAHYDIALRTSAAAHGMLMPILVQASRDSALLPAMAQLLAPRPVWRINYLRALQSDPATFDTAAQLSMLLDGLRSPLTRDQKNEFATALVATGKFAAAARMMGRAREKTLIRYPTFGGPADNGPFDWTLTSTYEFGGTQNDRGGLAVSAQGERGGQVARQLLVLKPGTYRLVWAALGGKAARGSGPFWQIACAETGGPLLANLEVLLGGGRTVSGGVFAVPATGCRAQWLILNTRPVTQSTGYDTIVERLAIDRVG